ncbi:FAD dependent oxidoreductase [Niveomyces insectorum RCEF 264]|uniref:FAD dependent oxidoreductase n=1 Tax=Niveomyces insectorum RCEF 264 TaxID=1081102 RepID=A0A167MHN0_9HYPO|nr:FAD dependent oxidoreductase [Niveomyces insectorum RCEF 264]
MASAQSIRAAHFMQTSGASDVVWVHSDDYASRPKFSSRHTNRQCDAREVLSGETGRTSGHLSNALDDHYIGIVRRFGPDGARAAADSHTWAVNHVGDVVQKLGIECEYRRAPGYEISLFTRRDKRQIKDPESIKRGAELAQQLGGVSSDAATNIPLQKLAIVAQLAYDRTYCVAIRVLKDSVEDCFIYDSAESYRYIRLAGCDDADNYMIVG